MEPVGRQFVERRDESFYLAGSRIPIASVVREFQDGQSPEAIRSGRIFDYSGLIRDE